MYKYPPFTNNIYGGDKMDELHEGRRLGIFSLLLRIVVNAIVLLVVSYFVPGFFVSGIWTAIIAAAVIGILDYLVGAIFKIDASPFGRGITGFIIAAIIIYVTQFFVAGVAVTFWGAIIGALLIGLVDLIIPGRVM
jgi:uncharacterized membrane protein YvlD (DUF360 family)